MLINLIESIYLKILTNKLTLHGYNRRYLNLIFLTWKTLKLQRWNPTILFFFILNRLKTDFTLLKNKHYRKKKLISIKYIPKYLNYFSSIKLAIKWFLIPFHINFKKFNFIKLLEPCFLMFINEDELKKIKKKQLKIKEIKEARRNNTIIEKKIKKKKKKKIKKKKRNIPLEQKLKIGIRAAKNKRFFRY